MRNRGPFDFKLCYVFAKPLQFGPKLVLCHLLHVRPVPIRRKLQASELVSCNVSSWLSDQTLFSILEQELFWGTCTQLGKYQYRKTQYSKSERTCNVRTISCRMPSQFATVMKAPGPDERNRLRHASSCVSVTITQNTIDMQINIKINC